MIRTRGTMKKNNTILLIAIFITTVCLYYCSSNIEYVPIQIPIKKLNYLDPKDYNNIYYKPFQIKDIKPVKNLNIDKIISDYFLYSFSSLLDKDIEPLPTTAPDTNSLIIDGTISLKILERNVIKKIRDSGKRKNKFVKIENWILEMNIILTSTKNQKHIFEKKYKRQLEEADPEDPIFNFKSIFSYCTDQFAKDVFKSEKIEQRFLLYK